MLYRARRRMMTSEARFPSRMVRRAVSSAPMTLGGSAESIRTHVFAFVTMPASGWLTSCAIEAASVLRLVALAT